MDIADRADEEVELTLARALRAQRALAPLPAVGACYYCGSDVNSDLRFCGSDCRDDFDAEHAALRRAGKA